MSEKQKLNRRGFLNAGLLATGGVAGWLTGCDQAPQAPAPRDRKPLERRSAFEVCSHSFNL